MKIVGGMVASPLEFPYQIQLEYNSSLQCGGSLLSSLFILTAAHCVKYKLAKNFRIIAGDHDRFEDEGNEQIRNVAKIYMHEDYSWDTDQNDIAIVLVDKPFDFKQGVGIIDFSKSRDDFSGMGVVTGWGKISSTSPASDVLRKVKVPIVEREECQRKYQRVRMKVTESMMCAGAGGLDSCQGDSGGPLICEDEERNKVQCGIVSHGIGCGQEYPGVYTHVGYFSEWIQTIMETARLRKKCRRNNYYCDDSCISRVKLCDGRNDCKKGQDEKGCVSFSQSSDNHFRCDNGLSIKSNWVCDNFDDCGDGSDEEKCRKSSNGTEGCGNDEISCRNDGRCIPKEWQCDNLIDCEDGLDEANCNNEITTTETVVVVVGIGNNETCSKGFFRCPGKWGVCIPDRWKCDGERDCKNGEDERNCVTSTTERSTTFSTTTVTTTTTMASRPCRSEDFRCVSDGKCINKHFLCDFDRDCADNSDESSCFVKTACTSFQWKCQNNDCIYHRFRCDGEVDCLDSSDELGCNLISTSNNNNNCSRFQFACENGECIYGGFKCDGDEDCPSGEDERVC